MQLREHGHILVAMLTRSHSIQRTAQLFSDCQYRIDFIILHANVSAVRRNNYLF